MCLELEEVVRLLKSKGIRLHRDQSEAGAEDDAKRKLYASYLKKKKHQTERHVLRKEMTEHAIPRLFVSQRSDKSPNGFNCAICRKDISYLSKGEPEIWRHFGSKTHFLRDRRYRLDHEDYLYTPRFDAVEVSSISAELRAEIEKLQLWFLVVRTRSSRVRWMLWLGCHRTFLLPLLWGFIRTLTKWWVTQFPQEVMESVQNYHAS